MIPERIAPGSHEEDIFKRLLPAMSRAGRAVDAAACERLAVAIQHHGHKNRKVRDMAREMGIPPKFLPRRRA